MTTSNGPNAKEQQNAKIGAWKEHVADIDARVQQLQAFESQMGAQLRQLEANMRNQVGNWITGLQVLRKTLQTKIDAGV